FLYLLIAGLCACALATSTSIMAGWGRAAEMGLLFKVGEYLETTQTVDTIVLDKTGTVTKGEPKLTDIHVAAGFDEELVLRLAASAERHTEQQLAKCIVH